MKSRLIIAGLVLSFGTLAYAATFTPIPLNPSSFNADPVIEASAPPSLNDFANVTPDAGTNKTGNTWYEMGYNTNVYASPTYSGPLTGLPHPGTVFTARSNPNYSFQMAPTYVGNCVIFVGHNNSQWTPILGPGTFTLTTPAAYDHLSVVSGTGNGANNIQATVNHQDGTSEQIVFSSPDWFTQTNAANDASAVWRAGGLVNMQGGVNNQNGAPGTLWKTDLALGNTTSPVTNVVFTWFRGSSNGDSPWGNGRTFIFAISGSGDGGATFSPITVTGYDHDGIVEASAPRTTGAGSAALTGVLTNNGTYCNFTMDNGIYRVNWTWYEKGYYAAYPNTGLPAAGSTITSATEPGINYTMPSTYVGNCAVCLSSNLLSDTITFASPTSAGSLAFLCGGGNGGLNLRVEIAYQGGSFETNWIFVPDWFNRTAPWSYVTFGQVRPEMRALRNTPDQLQNNWVIPQTFGGLPPGQPFSRDPRNGGASFPDLPIVRLFDAVMPVAGGGPISSVNVVVTNTGAFGNSVSIFAVSGGAGAPPALASTIPNQPSGQPFGLVTDSATGLTNSASSTNATSGRAVANNIILYKGWQGTNNISLYVSNSFPAGASYQWKRAPRGGGWRDSFVTDYDMSTFVNVSGPNIGGSTSNWLTISNATLADSADYLVVVTNNYGSTTSFVATVMVLTTNNSVLVGAGGGDSISLYTSDGSTGGSETFLSASDQAAQKWLSTGNGSFGFDGLGVAKATIPFIGPGGYVVTPVNGTSIVSSIQFYCANDGQGRDPRDYLLEGSLDGSTWSTITGGQLLGTLMLPVTRGGAGPTALNPMTQPLMEVDFANSTPYNQYRVTITNNIEPVATPLMQVAEIRLMGTLLPSAPVWVRQPEPAVTVFVGTSPTWGVLAGGVPKPKFQWFTNGVAALNATNATFTLANVQLADSGKTVFVRASNIGGTIESVHSTLTVIAAPTQSYPSAVLANGPMAYWRLDEGPDNGAGNQGVVTHDYAGGHNGYYSNTVIAVEGYNPVSDPNTAARFGDFPPSDNLVANINNLDFARNANTAGAVFSIEAWVLGGNQSVDAAILAKGYNGNLNPPTQTGTEQFALDVTGGNPRKFRFLVRGASSQGYQAQSSVVPYDPVSFQPTWRHLVGVCDQPNGNIYLYVDGELAASGTIPSNAGILTQPLPMTIGSRQSGQGTDYDNQWTGTIDDVSVYPSALSASQVLTHFYAAQRPPEFSLQPSNLRTNDNTIATFFSLAYGPGTVTYQWYNSDSINPTTPIGGQTSPNYSFTATPGLSGNYYQVVAASAFGSVTSAVAQLTVESGPPGFVFQDLPVSQTVFLGHVIQLHVAPSGTAPFTYQWQKNSVNMSDDYRTAGTTSDTLTIGYANFADTANYNVIVTGQGSTSSTVDALTVTTNNGFFNAGSTTTDWQLNNNGGAAAVLYGTNAIQLTSNAGNTANSAFLKVQRNIASFTASFLYQLVTPNGGGADGITFCIQNDARGATAVGGGGGALGYTASPAVTPSVALALNIYAPNTRGIEFDQNGAGFTTPFTSLLPNVSIGDSNTNRVKVDLNYDGTTLAAKFTDLPSGGTFTTNVTVNIPSIVGGNNAYVGFTGADGGVASTQIASWVTPSATRIPIKVQHVGGNTLFTWPASAGAFLQMTPSLNPTSWTYDNTDTFRVVGTNATVTVSTSAAAEFFRLQLFP